MPTPLTLYRMADGRLSFYRFASVAEVPAELSDGYRLDENAYDGQLKVFGKPGELGMSLENAMAAGVLRVVESP